MLLTQAYFIFSEREQQFQFVKGVLAKNVLSLYATKKRDGVRERIINCFEMSDHDGTPFTTDADPLRVSYSCFTPEFNPRCGETTYPAHRALYMPSPLRNTLTVWCPVLQAVRVEGLGVPSASSRTSVSFEDCALTCTPWRVSLFTCIIIASLLMYVVVHVYVAQPGA
jgi:hypothetical protein